MLQLLKKILNIKSLYKRELNLIGVPDAFLKPQTICISDNIENKLEKLKIMVQDQIEKTFYVSTYRMSFARGEDVDLNQIGIGYQDHELDL